MGVEERQFEQFRRSGDTEALAGVFDATAPELWRVAWYLSGGDRHRAEDALQATFLKAIEDRHRWESARPLRPWLLGILGNQVRNDRKRAKRAEGKPDVLDSLTSEQRPSDAAAEAEVRELAMKAMRELPTPYRDVVILHVEHGLSAQDIATALDRKPGTVRTQVVRGLELLRKALPAGVAVGAMLAAPTAAVAAEVLRAVRAEVLAHGSLVVAATAPSTLSVHSTWKSYAMLTTVLAIVSTTAWALWPDTSSPSPTTTTHEHEVSRVEAADFASLPRDVIVESEPTVPDPEPVAQANRRTVKALVLGSDDKPRAGVSVMYNADSRLQLETTDDEGRCEFEILGNPNYYQVGLAAYPASDWAFHTMQDKFGGEHVLRIESGMELEIEVVDRNGEPVEGAVVEGIIGNQWGRMYNVLGTTDAGGVLRIVDAAPRGGQLRAFASGHQMSGLRNISGKVGETVRTKLKLGKPAFTATGQVVDENGEPAPGAQVAIVQFTNSPTRQYVVADENGRFRFDWLTPGRHMLVAELYDGETSRMGQRRFEYVAGIEPDVRVEIAPAATLSGIVTNASGDPAPNSAVYVEYIAEGVYDVPFTERSIRADGNGHYRLEGLLAGPNRVRATIDDADVRSEVVLAADEPNEWNPQGVATLPLSARVVDERGEPLVGWRVSMWSLDGYSFGTTYVTGPDGINDTYGTQGWQIAEDKLVSFAVFAPLPEGTTGFRDTKFDYFPTHTVPPVGPAAQPHVIRVPDSQRVDAAIVGRLLGSEGNAHERASVTVYSERSSSAFSVQVWCDPETGRFAIEPLSAGKYTLRFRVPGEARFSRKVRVGAAERLDIGEIYAPRRSNLTIVPEGGDTDSLTVKVRHASGWNWTARRQADGSYLAKNVFHGDTTVVVWGRDIPSRSWPVKLDIDKKLVVELPKPVTPTPVLVQLPDGQEVFQQSWSGTLTVRDADSLDLVMEKRVRHAFRGVYKSDLEFSLPLEPGKYRIEVESWDDQRAQVTATVPGGRVKLDLPLRED